MDTTQSNDNPTTIETAGATPVVQSEISPQNNNGNDSIDATAADATATGINAGGSLADTIADSGVDAYGEAADSVVADNAASNQPAEGTADAVKSGTPEDAIPGVADEGRNVAQAPAPDAAMDATATDATAMEATATDAAPRRASRQPSMAQIMESDEYMGAAGSLQRGALLKGTVMHVGDAGEVLVDIGAKSEAIMSKNEVGDEEISVGDEVEVVVLRSEDEEGHPVVSKRRADYERLWRELQQAKVDDTTIEGTVKQQVKGGLIVDLGVSAFVPASHIGLRHRGNLAHLVGKTIPVKIVEIDRKRDKIIASHRRATEEDRRSRATETWKELEKDKIVEGVVRRITDFGAFIDLGGVDGLLHVSEMAWSRVEHPGDVVKKGQKLQVLVLDVDEERKRVALGLKQLQSDPWKKASKNYTPGQVVTGKVTHLAQSCAFVELEEGIEGIIPISEMSEERIKTPQDVLAEGQEIEARIKQVQPNQRRITLSLRAAARERERRETRTAVREVNERATTSPGGGDDAVRLGDIFGQQLREARDRGRDRVREKKRTRSEARERALEAAEEEEDWSEVKAHAPNLPVDDLDVEDAEDEDVVVDDPTVDDAPATGVSGAEGQSDLEDGSTSTAVAESDDETSRS